MDARFYSLDTLLEQVQGWHEWRVMKGFGSRNEWGTAGFLARLRDAIANEENQ